MKKNIILTCAIFVVAFFASCNNQDSQIAEVKTPESADSQEMVKLLENLNAYNDAFYQEHSNLFVQEKAITRAWGWGRWLRLIWDDARGAMRGAKYGGWGALAGAAICSLFSALEEDAIVETHPMHGNIIGGPINEPNENGHLDPIDETVPDRATFLEYTLLSVSLPMCADSVGYYHNSILYDYCVGNSLALDTALYVSAICNQAEAMSANGRGTTTNAQLLEELEFSQFASIYPTLKNKTSFASFVEDFEELFDDDPTEVAFLKNYVETLAGLDQDENDGSYAEGVLTLISNSQLSTDAKKRLGEAVITGNASAKLWNIEKNLLNSH